MPRYYFHIKRGQMTTLDQEGVDLRNTCYEKIAAAQRAKEIRTQEGPEADRRAIIIADDNWDRLLEFQF